MKKHLFINDKTIYKANMHCHTTVSDGTHTPEAIKEMYKARGYSIIAFTDHRLIKSHENLNDNGFLAINACEVDINPAAMNTARPHVNPTYHLNLYATRPDMTDSPPLPTMDYYDSQAVNQYIADRTKEGFLVCCNHPYWSLNTYAEYSKLKGCFAMEIYNHNCEVDDGCCGYAPQVYDDMLRLENKLFCFAADDNHNYGPSHLPDKDSFGGFININSSSLKYEDVITALIDGNFYASQGSEIYEISLEDSALTVQCSPAQSVRVYTQGRKCYEQTGNGLTKATFQLSGDEGYIRIVCRDKDHKVANSNAYWI